MAIEAVHYEKTKITKGYTNKLLNIDLGNQNISTSDIPQDMQHMFVGGRGYCLKLVFDGTNANTQYDSPENVLALAGGPFCGENGFAGTGKAGEP